MLLLIYLSQGIKKLMRYWNLLIFYQAIVLVVMVSFQFMVHTPNFKDSNIKVFFDSWPTWAKTGWHWLGFEKFDDPINLKLLPYVIFFSLAVILSKNFNAKLQIEQRRLYTYDDVDEDDDYRNSNSFSYHSNRYKNSTNSNFHNELDN